MKKRKSRMTDRRYKILKLLTKGLNNEQIAKEMELSLSNTKLQKWHLYSYLSVNNALDAIYVGLQMGLLTKKELYKSMKGKIYGNENEKGK